MKMFSVKVGKYLIMVAASKYLSVRARNLLYAIGNG